MMQSLKEFIYEFEQIEYRIKNSSCSYTIEEIKDVGILSLGGQNSFRLCPSDNNILVHIVPNHLSTITPFDIMRISHNFINIYGHEYDETFPFIKSEESYFQQSMICNLSNIPFEFIVRCEEFYNNVLKVIK